MKKILVAIILAVILTSTILLPGLTFADDDNPLEPMTHYSGVCSLAAGTSIGGYYRDREVSVYGSNYASLPDDGYMYDLLDEYMDMDLITYVNPVDYGPGFVEMALHYGYDKFRYEHDNYVSYSDYGKVTNAIDNGWPVALTATVLYEGFSDVDALPGSDDGGQWPCEVRHWIAIKGYCPWYQGHDNVVICVDSYSGADYLYLDWDQIVAGVGSDHLEFVIIKDDETPDAFVEDFEWESAGVSLEEWQDNGGEVDWEVVGTNGDSGVKIDENVYHGESGQSARFYRDTSSTKAYYSLPKPFYIGFWLKKGDTASASFRIGDGDYAIWVRVNTEEELQYTEAEFELHTLLSLDLDWNHIEFRNIDWGAHTFDIYVNDYRPPEGNDAEMRPYSVYNGLFNILNQGDNQSEFWIDDINDSLANPEATTLELLPATGENPVNTTHDLTATVYDKFGCEVEDVAVTWTIESGPGSFVSQDTTTDADGQADAVITSSVPGTSTVTCTVTDTEISDTATNDWRTCLEDFEWGSDGTSLGVEPPPGDVDWTVTKVGWWGNSRAEIDTAHKYTGTRSARLYRGNYGFSYMLAFYSHTLAESREFYFYFEEGSDAVLYTYTGDGDYRIYVTISLGGDGDDVIVGYYDGASWKEYTVYYPTWIDKWRCLKFENIDWVNHTYDIRCDSVPIIGVHMPEFSGPYGTTAYYNAGGFGSECWIDDISHIR